MTPSPQGKLHRAFRFHPAETSGLGKGLETKKPLISQRLLFFVDISGILLNVLICLVVPRTGIEPAHPFEYQNLNLARLPIPPPRQ